MKRIRHLIDSRLFQWTLTGIVAATILRGGRKLLPECSVLPDFCSPFFATAVVLALIYRIVNAYGWTLVLKAMNQKVDGFKATQIWIHAESRRWLPGGVWGYASRASQAGQLNVSKVVASASMLVELLLTLAASVIVFLPVVLLFHNQLHDNVAPPGGPSAILWISAAVVGGLAAGCWFVRHQLANKLNVVRERLQLLKAVSFNKRGLFVALAFYVVMALLNGFVTACLLWSLPLNHFPPLSMIVAATSLSWVIGFFAIFAPGGLVVREASFAILIGFWAPYSTGLAVGVLARIVQMGAEICGMIWVWWSTTAPVACPGDVGS